MKILVTGAGGFIGSAFVRLAAAGGHQVMALLRHPPPGPLPVSRWSLGSLREPKWDEIRSFQPDACMHAAWIVGSEASWDSPENEVCLEDSIFFLSRLRDLGLRHVVATGTCAEYAAGSSPKSEATSPLAPGSLYARSKDSLRQWGERNFATGPTTFCWARIFYAYGPGEPATRLCSQLMISLLRQTRCTIRAPLAKKDYIFIDDVARALLLLITREESGIFNVASGESIAVGALARLIAGQCGADDLLDFPAPEGKDLLGDMIADIHRLRAAGFEAAWPLSRGLSELRRRIPDGAVRFGGNCRESRR